MKEKLDSKFGVYEAEDLADFKWGDLVKGLDVEDIVLDDDEVLSIRVEARIEKKKNKQKLGWKPVDV